MSGETDSGTASHSLGGLAWLILPDRPASSTPPHQDYVHLQGTEEVWAAWLSLDDCPRQMGGLTLMPGSHRHGLYPVYYSPAPFSARQRSSASANVSTP